ncbi:MAG: proline--tRNA ligase [Candidatus Pacebacteria bacterium]|nr:proline--tRNA ligase [Candidatus Paceibacterota bacterium]
MRQSLYFLPTLKEVPTEAQTVSHRLMLRAGMVRQVAAGIYSWLPLGQRVLDKIADHVRAEQVKTGAMEIIMPTLQPAELWQESGRYDDYGKEMLRITDRHDRPLLYGPTAEEVVTDIVRNSIKSYRSLPLNLFQIHWKFRDEVRPRFGVMRGREFLMKDGYGFDLDEASARFTYQKMFVSYLRILRNLGLNPIPLRADTGPIGGDLSHEFIILAETGESQVYCHQNYTSRAIPDAVDYDDQDHIAQIVKDWTADYAAADDLHNPATCKVPDHELLTARGIEVGHIFYFGTKYSTPMKAAVSTESGGLTNLHMGSYGIGVSRLVGGIIEASHDDLGIIWPKSVAPFQIALINLKAGDSACDSAANLLYKQLTSSGIEVLLDDRDERAGVKLAEADLLGLPLRLVIGPKGVAAGTIEVVERANPSNKREIALSDALGFAVEWVKR